MKRSAAIAIALLLCLLLAGCGLAQLVRPAATVDPHAGMVEVESGYGGKIWVELHEELDVSPFLGWNMTLPVPEGWEVLRGVDVSEHQGAVDWAAVADSGVRFAVLRAGYRGYGEAGVLAEDAQFRANLAGARAAGLEIGVYFFSQAVSAEEAVEEAEFLLALLEGVDPASLALPVFFDWEDIPHDDARTDDIGAGIMNECAAAFCARVAEKGYQPGLYAYRFPAYFEYDLPALEGIPLWIGALGGYSDFYYAHSLWQYAIIPGVPGIDGDVDRDLWFRPVDAGAE